ncbi:MAG: hypothetical protein IBX56_17145 [Methylomicrobium sp.]|nr:hypothetical protein [Methylomicrobium sp.]
MPCERKRHSISHSFWLTGNRPLAFRYCRGHATRLSLSASEKIAIIQALAEAIGRPIDLVDLATVSEPLLGQIVRNGWCILGNLISRHLIEQKLESLRRCLLRIESKILDDKSQLTADYDLQDIVALNLNRAVPLALDIGAHLIAGMDVPPPGNMGETFKQ